MTTRTHPSGTATPWEELVTSALLGTDRRPPSPESVPPGKEPPLALLDAAAVETLRRRAGLRPAAAPADRPAAAPHDPRPEPPAAARRRLAQLLADRGARGLARGRGHRGLLLGIVREGS
ncbi:hypothetical protein AB0957_12390, partial [Streptomyces zhihengii]